MTNMDMFRKFNRTLYSVRKNRRINRNIRAFMADYSENKNMPRETDFQLEVLIPCYNHGRFLRMALSSIPAGVSATVIDDASTDGSREVAIALKREYNFKLICNASNLNQAGSLNRAITESDSNLFIVLNADDFLVKYCVPTVLGLFQKYPTVRMTGAGCIPFSHDRIRALNCQLPDKLDYEPAIKLFGSEEASNYRALNDINMTMSGCAFLRSAWQAVDGFWGFDRRVCSYDDRDFQMRVSALFDVAVIEEPLSMYRVDSSLGRAEYV